MRDILMELYTLLSADTYVKSLVDNKSIKIDNYPEPSQQTRPYIVMSEVDDTLPREYADNDNLALSYLIQVDVYAPLSTSYNAREVCKDLSYHISRLIKEQLDMENVSNSQPEYDKDLKIYRRAKRYEGIFYRKNLMNN